MLSNIIDLLLNDKTKKIILSIIIVMTLLITVNNQFLLIKEDIEYLKEEIKEFKKQNLINQKIKIEQEIKFLSIKEKNERLTDFEKTKLVDLMVEREKILIELLKLTSFIKTPQYDQEKILN